MAIDVSAEFAIAKNSVDWAQDAINEFDSSAKAFFNAPNASVVIDFDPKTREYVKKLVLKSDLPSSLNRKATEALVTARHAFDQATFAARNIAGIRSNKSVYYPWSATPTDLEILLDRRRIDERLRDTFRFHEPYPRAESHVGGDDMIRALATLANNKHTIGLAVYCQALLISAPPIFVEAARSFAVMEPKWNPMKKEMELTRWTASRHETQGDYEFRFEVILEDTRLPKRVNAFRALRDFVNKANFVVESLERRCLELKA